MKYELGNIIGSGSFGSVYELIEDNKKSCKVIKFVQPTSLGIENYIEHYILLQIKHNNLMFADDIILENNGLLKIIQLRAICDLASYLQFNKIKGEKQKILIDVTEGVSYLHQNNILHGDIKPENILVFEKNYKLTDFGMSKIIYKDKLEISKKIYTFIYRPPEVNENTVALKSDIWSLGCTFYEIYYGKKFFDLTKTIRYYHIPSILEKDKENFRFNNLVWKMIDTKLDSRCNINDVRIFFRLERIKIKNYLNVEDIKMNYKKFEINYKKFENIFLNKLLHIPCKYNISEKYKKIERNLCNKHKFKIENLLK